MSLRSHITEVLTLACHSVKFLAEGYEKYFLHPSDKFLSGEPSGVRKGCWGGLV
ncbi:hypothetical protein XNW1_3490003 [Xenorhabdus nematophila str. Websteri]|nr:hypothetical protein XNW1_3490003 [Xenorhabdus nematophila str. Websteri]